MALGDYVTKATCNFRPQRLEAPNRPRNPEVKSSGISPVYHKARVHSSRAFTLVEVMFATAVLALAVIGMIQAVVSGSEMLDVSRKQTIAAQIIHGQIDNVRLCNWSQI